MQRIVRLEGPSLLVPGILLLGLGAVALVHGIASGQEAVLRAAGLAALGVLGFANGANDLPKTVATLSGSGACSYRQAALLEAVATLAGGVIALISAGALLQLFSGGGILTAGLSNAPRVAGVIAAVAGGWVLIATRSGLPVSTTHALVGGSAGAALAAFGAGAVLGMASGRVRGPRAEGVRHLVHILSAVGASGARAWNDTPKIAGVGLVMVGIGAGDGITFELACLVGLVAAAMALGGLWASRRVHHALGYRLTTLDRQSAPAANVTNTVLVSGASAFGVPLSTTHVSGAALVGATGLRRARWPVARAILGAWITTVPATAVLAALLWTALALLAGG